MAYEIDLNCWANKYDRKFEKAREDEFFKRLIKKKIYFYNKEFKYEIIEENNIDNRYITKEEFNIYYNVLKKLISDSKLEEKVDNKLSKEIEEQRIALTEKISRISDKY